MATMEPGQAAAASPGRPGRAAAGVGWASAAALYLGAYVAAELSSSQVGLRTAVLWALAHGLPDLAGAPLVLRATSRAAGGGTKARLALSALGFLVVSIGGASLGAAALRYRETGAFVPLDAQFLPWRAFLSVLVLALLAGVGRARLHAREAREASERVLRAEALRAEARLAALRARVEPHFVLNVLHSVLGLVERDPAAATAALERLGSTLRYAQRVTEANGDQVALREEVEFTREYLELERLRLGERLQARLHVPPSLLGRGVPPFVLQPLVENAVLHAVAPRARGGVVEVRVEEAEGGLRLTVDDDGDAAPRPAGPEPERSGRGLKLLRERLEALHPGRAAVTLRPSRLGGLRAEVLLPAEDEGGEG